MTGPDDRFDPYVVDLALSGAAVTITTATPSDPLWECANQTASSAQCWQLAAMGTPVSITLTITPTEAGAVILRADAQNYVIFPAGTDSLTTQVENPAPALPFTGFFSPVHDTPAVNSVNAGRSIPIKFSLDGDKSLNVLAAGFPTSRATACGTGTADPAEATTSTSGLTYDAASGTYTYAWRTEKAWAGTCRTFHLALVDGTDHVAYFQFK
ncbi:PxKF domain-containing protein [Streptomyces sp. NPDC005775]|uniref:PxKF domain-containing protein n=1 Tax=Streptomyces sp. NPDC005775 TaxID=3364729 RepID=UPI0036B510DA